MQLEEFKALNKRNGFHWFEPATMSFFRSEIESWDSGTGVFISSEKPPEGKRQYSVRYADFQTGNVKTLSKFCEFNNLKQADKFAANYDRRKHA